MRVPVYQVVHVRRLLDPRVLQALVRIRAYLLADIVVAIPAVDLAVEAVVCSVVHAALLYGRRGSDNYRPGVTADTSTNAANAARASAGGDRRWRRP
jgi:hypothetical protein